MFGVVSTLLGQGTRDADLQKLVESFDEAYGVDYNLVNGIKHVNFYADAVGHPFLIDNNFRNGWVEIRGIKYENQKLNYDIYNQQIIAEYTSKLIGIQRFIIPNFHLKSFEMEGRLFRKMKIGDREERFYEILSNGKYPILFSYDRKYEVNTGFSEKGFYFSDIIKRMYMRDGAELIRFTSNRNFRNLFPESIHKDIRYYMKRYRINVKRSGVEDLKKMIEYINTLGSEG
jgi:hypothetical protein